MICYLITALADRDIWKRHSWLNTSDGSMIRQKDRCIIPRSRIVARIVALCSTLERICQTWHRQLSATNNRYLTRQSKKVVRASLLYATLASMCSLSMTLVQLMSLSRCKLHIRLHGSVSAERFPNWIDIALTINNRAYRFEFTFVKRPASYFNHDPVDRCKHSLFLTDVNQSAHVTDNRTRVSQLLSGTLS